MIVEEIYQYIAAGYSGIWVQTWEPEDVVEELQAMCLDKNYLLFQHNAKDGLLEYLPEGWSRCTATTAASTPGRVKQPIRNLAESLAYLQQLAVQTFSTKHDQRIIVALWHAHMYPEGLIDDIRLAMNLGEQYRLHLIFLSHTIKPLELLRPRIAIIEHALPTTEQLLEIAKTIANRPGDIPDQETLTQTIAAAKGMTRVEARNAFALSLATAGQLSPSVVWTHKAQALKTGNQAVRLSTETEPDGFADVGGLAALKNFHTKLLLGKHKPIKAIPRGTLLLGIPGTGKDWYAEALGKEAGWPVLHLNLGRTRNKYQGETEANTLEVFRKAERMAPCILAISEIEKMFDGLQSSGRTDGGTKSNQVAEFLDWMQRRKELIYLLASCNDLSPILESMPAFIRSGRFDRIFYLDVPSAEAQEQIWAIHTRAYGLLMPFGIKPKHLMDPEEPQPTEKQIYEALAKLKRPSPEVRASWTGTEIESCCQAADLSGEPLDSPDCEPTVITDIGAEHIQKSREWAIGRAYSAEVPGRYWGPPNAEQQYAHKFNQGSKREVRRNMKGN